MVPASADVKKPAATTSMDVLDKVASGAFLKHKRRYCRMAGCQRIVKSQGLCQRHGAKPKTCKVDGCTKQAQGNFDRMCKAHFKALKRQTTPIPKVVKSSVPPPAQGRSVFDGILPKSISYSAAKGGVMPLIAHLQHGFECQKPPAWHRNEERAARGIIQIDNPGTQLEGWERELVWMEILVLTGVPGASFRHLARAWGRDKGFHMVLAQFICERHGDVERKKRQAEKNAKAETDEQGKKKLRFKRRKINRYGLEAKQQDDMGTDVWDPAMYGDTDTNEALASEIFDFSEKEFHRVTAKYRGMSTSSVGSDNGSEGQNMMAQAAMTAILGPQNGVGMQQNLPEAAVALAAMNRIPAPLPTAYKTDEIAEATRACNPDAAVDMEVHGASSQAGVGFTSSQQILPHSQQVQHLQQPQQQIADQVHLQHVQQYSEPALQFVQQTVVQPQVQQVTKVMTGFTEAEGQQPSNSSVYAVKQGATAVSCTTGGAANHAQVPVVHTTQVTHHLSTNPNASVVDTTGPQGQPQVAQTQPAVVTQQQQIQYQVVPQQQGQQEMQHAPQQTLQITTQQFQHQSLPQPPHGHYSPLTQQLHSQDHLINVTISQQQQKQPQQIQHVDQGTHVVTQTHYMPAAQEQQSQQHAAMFEQQQQHMQQTMVQPSQHAVLAESTTILSQQNYSDQIQQHQEHNQSYQHDAVKEQHGMQHEQHGLAIPFSQSQNTVQQSHPHAVQQQQRQQESQHTFQGHAEQHCQVQQHVTQQVVQQQYGDTSQQQQQHVAHPNHQVQNMVVTHVQQHEPSGLPEAQGYQVAVQQQVTQQVQFESGVPQQLSQPVHTQNHVPVQTQQVQHSWSTLQQTPQVAQPHHTGHRHHRRQHSQPVYFGQAQSPGQNRHHRRQHSQPAYLHDLSIGQAFSFSQQHANPVQGLQHPQQTHHQINPTSGLVHSQDVSHTPFQQQEHHQQSYEQQQQQAVHQQPSQVLPLGNYDHDLQITQRSHSSDSGQHESNQQYQQTQEVNYHQPEPHVLHQSQEASDHVNHPQQNLGNDPLDIHHEMHVAQANGNHYQQENNQQM